MDPGTLAGIGAIASTVIFTGGPTIGGLVLTAALSGASYLLQSAFAPKAPKNTFKDQGQKVISRQSLPPQRLIVGRALVGGPLIFFEVKPPYLYYGIVLASHEIDGVDEVRIGEKVVMLDANGNATSVPFRDGSTVFLQVSIRTGTDDQAIDPIVAADFPEIPSTWRQRGHATAFVKMFYGADRDEHESIWGNAGEPKPLFLVRGAKAYDPNDPSQSTSDASTWTFTDNAARLIAWYMTHNKGARVSWSNMDLDALKNCTNADGAKIGLASGGYESRYTINGVIDLEREPADNLNDLLTANLGSLVWRGGSYALSSGVKLLPERTLTQDSARGGAEFRHGQTTDNLVNTVRTQFVAADREYQLVLGPVVTNSTYVTADGVEKSINIPLPFTTSHTTAQRIAKALMEKSRKGRTVRRRENIEALDLTANIVVNYEYTALSFIDGEYLLNKIVTDGDGEFMVEAEEYAPNQFDWDPAVDEKPFTINPAVL